MGWQNLQALELGHVWLQPALNADVVVEAVQKGHGRSDGPGRARRAEELMREKVAAFADEGRFGQVQVLEGLVELLALHLLPPLRFVVDQLIAYPNARSFRIAGGIGQRIVG